LDGQDISGIVNVTTSNGSFRTWNTVTVNTPLLTAGNHEMQIVVDSAPSGLTHLNTAINFLEFTSATPPTTQELLQNWLTSTFDQNSDGKVNVVDFAWVIP
jgi:hypothetical protein